MICKNCKKNLQETDDFCNSCGAKVIRNRLTVRNLWGDLTEQFFNYDNRFIQTYLTIFKNPEKVIGGYINGTRKKYVNVISYFALAITFSGLQLFILLKFFPESMDLTALMPENAIESSFNMDWMYDYYSFFVLLNLPLYALVSKLTFIGLKKFNYTEHVVINTYILAQFSMTNSVVLTIFCIAGGNFYVGGNVMNIIVMVFTAYVFKKLYELSLKGILLRFLFFIAILAVGLVIVGLIQLGVLIINGDFKEMIEAEKAKRAVTYIASSIMNWTS